MGEALEHIIHYSLEGDHAQESCRSPLWGYVPPLAMGFPTSLQPPPLHFFPSPRPTWVPPCPCITWPPGTHLALNEANTQLYAKRYFATAVAVLGTCPPPSRCYQPLPLTPADGCQQVAPGIAHGHQRDLRLPWLHGRGRWRC